MYVAAHEQLIDEYLEAHPRAGWQEAYEAVEPFVGGRCCEREGDHADFMRELRNLREYAGSDHGGLVCRREEDCCAMDAEEMREFAKAIRLASAIEARSAETTKIGSAEGESAVGSEANETPKDSRSSTSQEGSN